MMRGKLQAVIEGNYMGSYRPYGYDILKTKQEEHLFQTKKKLRSLRISSNGL